MVRVFEPREKFAIDQTGIPSCSGNTHERHVPTWPNSRESLALMPTWPRLAEARLSGSSVDTDTQSALRSEELA